MVLKHREFLSEACPGLDRWNHNPYRAMVMFAGDERGNEGEGIISG